LNPANDSFPVAASTITLPPMPLPRKVSAVVFDMDGLLFDTEALYRDVVIATALETGHDLPLDFYLSTVGTPLQGTRELFVQRYGAGFDFDSFWGKTTQRFAAIVETELRLKAGVLELLALLDELALPRAIATSSRHEHARHHLTAFGLTDRFHAVIAHGDYARGKPHPDPFLKAAERLGVEPALCLALEDSWHGVRAASAAGMMTVMVPDLMIATPEMTQICAHIASDLHEVGGLMKASGASA
jgi:HAD superfamily hydrolase (TIGR01509 family)